MTVNHLSTETTETTDTTASGRPAARRRLGRTVAAVAAVGALIVPTAGVALADPFGGFPAVSADARDNGNGNANGNASGKGNGNGQDKGGSAEETFLECLQSVNPSGNGKVTPAVVMKGMACLSQGGDLTDPGSLTVDEATTLISQGLDAVESAGISRERLPEVLDEAADNDLIRSIIGEEKSALLDTAADSELIEAYAEGDLSRDEVAEIGAEALVAG